MTRILRLTLEIPDGVTVKIEGLDEPAVGIAAMSPEDAVHEYWRHYLSVNSRKVFLAAARIEEVRGPGFTLEDIAANISLTYASVRSLHRTSGRAAKKWREEKGIEAPVRLEAVDYPEALDGLGRRTRYKLPEGVCELVIDLPAQGWHPIGHNLS